MPAAAADASSESEPQSFVNDTVMIKSESAACRNVLLPGQFGGGHRRRASGASVSEPAASFVPAASAPLGEGNSSAGSTPHSHFYPQHHPGGHREGAALHEPLLHDRNRLSGVAENQEGLRLLLRGGSGSGTSLGAEMQASPPRLTAEIAVSVMCLHLQAISASSMPLLTESAQIR